MSDRREQGGRSSSETRVENEGVSYRGTFLLVLLLGVFIVAAWTGMFFYFLWLS